MASNALTTGIPTVNAYTLAYTEAFDAVNQQYRVQGRFKDANVVELFFFNADLVYQYDVRHPTTTCTVTSVSKYPGINRARPSTQMFDFFTSSALTTYVGNVTAPESRNIPCDKWNVTIGQFGPSNASAAQRVDLTASVYYAQSAVDGVDRVPVRVLLSGTHSSVATGAVLTNVSHNYDWVNFVTGQPSPSLFVPPAGCLPGVPMGALPLPRNQTLVPRLGPGTNTTPVPVLPNQFTATLEATLHDATGLQVFTVVWTLDAPNRQSRYDVFTHSDPNDATSPTVVETSLYFYPPALDAWGSSGTVVTGRLAAAAAGYVDCHSAAITAGNQSPLLGLRAGFIPRIFADGDFLKSIQDPLLFEKTETSRGVPVDVFSSLTSGTRATTVGGVTYNYDFDLRFFPQGWSFPGRPASQYWNSQNGMPISIRDTGTYRTGGSGAPMAYNDTWNLFLLIPGPPPVGTAFDVTALGCPADVPTAPPTSPPVPPVFTMAPTPPATSYSAGSLAAGIVLSLLGGMALYGVGQWACRRGAKRDDDDVPHSRFA